MVSVFLLLETLLLIVCRYSLYSLGGHAHKSWDVLACYSLETQLLINCMQVLLAVQPGWIRPQELGCAGLLLPRDSASY